MSDGKISDRILTGIKTHSKGKDPVQKFLKELLFEEIKHTGKWRWKEAYEGLMGKHLKKGRSK